MELELTLDWEEERKRLCVGLSSLAQRLCVGLSSFTVSPISSGREKSPRPQSPIAEIAVNPYFVHRDCVLRRGDKSSSFSCVCVCVLRRGGSRVLTCVCVFFSFSFFDKFSVFLWNDEKMRGKWNGFRREERERIFYFFLIINNSF
jgi:hypothetical protein